MKNTIDYIITRYNVDLDIQLSDNNVSNIHIEILMSQPMILMMTDLLQNSMPMKLLSIIDMIKKKITVTVSYLYSPC